VTPRETIGPNRITHELSHQRQIKFVLRDGGRLDMNAADLFGFALRLTASSPIPIERMSKRALLHSIGMEKSDWII
jgi:hypothetical protein